MEREPPAALPWHYDPYGKGVASKETDRRPYRFEAGEAVPSGWRRIVAPLRGGAMRCGFLGIILSALGRPLGVISDDVALSALYPSCFLLALGVALSGAALSTSRAAPRPVGMPVRGRWMTFNSPADRVPSHGTHAGGQAFAIDLVYDPAGDSLPAGKERAFRRPEEFGGFGQEVFAPAAGRVVLVRDGARDHRSRSSPYAISFMGFEGFVRQALGGARLLAGNLVVLDLGDGVYAAMAHLKRRSATVRPGQHVTEGQLLGLCGNSGNSSQPHLHFQLMDHTGQSLAAGLPFTFTGINAKSPQGYLPRGGESFLANLQHRSRGASAGPA